MAIRAILADDHPLTREGLRSYLEHESDIQLVGEAADGIAAWDLIERELPDVALLDIRMPGEDGISLARKVRERKLPVAVLMLTTYDAQQYVLAALRAGAKGYVLKTATPDDLIQAIRTVASGGVYLDREVSSSVKAVDFMPESLSPREQEVLLLAGRGLSSKEVASQLIISERTVQTHLASIYDKLGARNKTEALLLALKYGVVTLEDLLE
ncbi:MAG TPA: response regulator transcription factor [Thermosynergistes sp.]|jgi:DNA-binding NarL/FixJ family response regulator|nr:response regulator transcription factor [Thermosynergistes sp.]HOM25201.1 response regulator transcription factor [Thermosynergistes sp.]HPP37882.1 response regulator transcription factor [Thermosynergistes sp.]HPU77997.1 response regulator transcription factor [Thermosynergistes sp.]HPZ76859.1 response regulator transcription factor [Thermosynergistes sp.]